MGEIFLWEIILPYVLKYLNLNRNKSLNITLNELTLNNGVKYKQNREGVFYEQNYNDANDKSL